MSSESVEKTIDEFEDYVSKTGDEVFERFSGEEDGSGYFAGLACNRGGNTYIVSTAEEFEHLNIEFQYLVVNDYSPMGEREDDTLISVGSDEPPEEVKEKKEQMGEFLQNIDEETKERFYIEVLDKLQNESVAWNIKTQNVHDIVGFNLFSRLFPDSDEISVKDFDNAVQSILSIGIPVRAYIQYTYSLQSDTTSSEPEGESNTDIPRFDL